MHKSPWVLVTLAVRQGLIHTDEQFTQFMNHSFRCFADLLVLSASLLAPFHASSTAPMRSLPGPDGKGREEMRK